MAPYPILFTFREKVSGTRFMAEVIMNGRLLASPEDEGWWMYGVEPGGLAAGGATPTEAFGEFKRVLTSVLYDIAADAKTFEQFSFQVRRFFREKNEASEAEWHEAVVQIRQGTITEQGIPVNNKTIRRLPADTKRSVLVKPLRAATATPRDNKVDQIFAVAA